MLSAVSVPPLTLQLVIMKESSSPRYCENIRFPVNSLTVPSSIRTSSRTGAPSASHAKLHGDPGISLTVRIVILSPSQCPETGLPFSRLLMPLTTYPALRLSRKYSYTFSAASVDNTTAAVPSDGVLPASSLSLP